METYQIDIKITEKDGKEHSASIENTTSSYLSNDEEPIVIALINPYTLCLCSSIDDLKEAIKCAFVYDKNYSYNCYKHQKAERYFNENSAFIKQISKIVSIENIKSIEISGYNPYDDNFGKITHKFDIEDMKYEVTDTSDHDLLGETRCEVIKFNPRYVYGNERYLSFFDSSFYGLPYGDNYKYIYDIEDKSIICPTCKQKIDKNNCLISRKHYGIYCDEYCLPKTKYYEIRKRYGHQKKVTVTTELIHTNERERVERIENLKVGTKVTLKSSEFFIPEGSIGIDSSGDLALDKLRKTEKNVLYDAWVSKVIPKSQRPKKQMKPIVEITITIDILIN